MSKAWISVTIAGGMLILIGVISLVLTGNVGIEHKYSNVRDPNAIPWMLNGIALDLGNPGDSDDKSVESPTIIGPGDGSYEMWYRGQTYSDKIGRLMRATSPDGINWTKTGVVMLPTEPYEGDKIDPMTVIYEQGIYKMWYGGEAYGGCACYATSTDGINWTKYADNPVLRKTSGNWDNEGAGGQCKVIKDGSKYLMYYKGYGSDAPGWTFYGLAESTDGIHWLKKGKVLSPEPQIGESTMFRNLGIFRLDGTYCILYAMADNLHLFLASGKDGVHFTRNGMVMLHGTMPGGYDEKWTTSPAVLVETGRVRMWYEGGDQQGRVRILYAESRKDQFSKALKNVVQDGSK